MLCRVAVGTQIVEQRINSEVLIGQFRIVQQQKNRVEVEGNNLHFPLF